MTKRYERGIEVLKEFTVPEPDNPTGHMDIGEGLKMRFLLFARVRYARLVTVLV